MCATREIARKFYCVGIVLPWGVGLDHPTWKEVRFDHILMILVCHCTSLIAHLIFSLLFRYTVHKWFFEMLLFFSPLFGFTVPTKYWYIYPKKKVPLILPGVYYLKLISQSVYELEVQNCQHTGSSHETIMIQSSDNFAHAMAANSDWTSL